MKLILKDAGDAKKILDYFNHFHDGFIKKFSVTSRDRFTAVKSSEARTRSIRHTLGEGYWVRIDFAHHNYRPGGGDARRIVRATFLNAKDIIFDLTLPNGSSNSRDIANVEILPASAEKPKGKSTMALFITWNVVLPDRKWHTFRNRILCFEQAIFDEAGISRGTRPRQ